MKSALFLFIIFPCVFFSQIESKDTLGNSLASDALMEFFFKRFDNSIAFANKSLKLNSNNTKAMYWKGRALGALKKYDEGIVVLNKLEKLTPEDAGLYYARGLIYWGKKDFVKSKKDFDKCLQLDPKYNEALLMNARIKSETKNYDAAILDYSEYLVKKPEDKNALFERGRTYLLLNKKDLACADYRKARKLGHDKANAVILELCPTLAQDTAADFWVEYQNEKKINAANAKSYTSFDKKNPESLVRYFYASRIRKDEKWKEVLPALENYSPRLTRQLEKYATWNFIEMYLVSKKKAGTNTFWVKIYMKIEVNGKTDGGTDEVTVKQMPDGTWVITEVPT